MALETAALGAAADALADTMRAHRRTLHRHPELGFAEHRTAAYIESVLRGLGIFYRRVVGTGVVAVLPGEGPGCVGVRADMDALPVTEAPGREGYRSEVPGVSHACGHDAHVAVALGLAEMLAGAGPLPGTVVLYFQPAEEGPGGAAPMVDAGVLDDPRPQAILALHVASKYPAGLVALRSGPVTASQDDVTVTVHGSGGHAAHPHTAIDPIPAAAQVVLSLQHLVSRELDPVMPAVVTVGSIHGGSRHNVIAPAVTLQISVRAVHPDTRELLLTRIGENAKAVAAAHRADAAVEIERGLPVGMNDPDLTLLVEAAARTVAGRDHVLIEPHPSLGSEDFFAFGDTGVPVCMFRLGVANTRRGITAPHHSPDFDVDEAALPTGAAVFAEAIRRLLTR